MRNPGPPDSPPRPTPAHPAAAAILVAAALLAAACTSTGSGERPPADPSAGSLPPGAPAGAGEAGAVTSGAAAEFAPPSALAEGDRWFVALRAATGPEPVAERSRRRRGEGFVREEVTWARSFGDLARMEHGTAQVFALLLGEKGLAASLLDGAGRPAGESKLEVAAPFRAGTAWIVPDPRGNLEARIAGIERAETPSGPVRALRVEVRAPGGPALRMSTWYDEGLRPVRAEIRLGSGEVLEARAALGSAAPTPEECRSALEWARKNLPSPRR